ncbi:MAG TPA: FAD-binding oxidoreductase [Bacillus sp. (in: firmicutes)]|nr:FAD-binding oxidoreductase [Bacillus sp. (in: firmicutes)]
MKRLAMTVLTIIFVCTFFFSISYKTTKKENEWLVHDVSRLFPVEVKEIIKGKEEHAIIAAVKKANDQNIPVSIAGKRHSQGGHIFYRDALLLDMTSYNKVLGFNEKEKTIRVQSGATWADIQQYVNPYGLSVKVMQSSNIFTVGGSLSVNAHGRDVRYGPLIETVNSFRLLKANGEIIEVSRTKEPELFSLVIGGYGLFGVILDVELQLTDNTLLKTEHRHLAYTEYVDYMKKNVLADPSYHLHIARLSTAPSSFLADMYAINYKQIQPAVPEEYLELSEEEWVRRNKFLFGLARKYDWGKELLWDIQGKLYAEGESAILSRNNAMRPEIQFLDYTSEQDTDILQEYFVPMDAFVPFVDDLRSIFSKYDLNVFNVTVRYVPRNTEAALSYSTDEMLALVPIFNHGFRDQDIKTIKKATREMVDAVRKYKGTYYLTYQLYPTSEQMKTVYPKTDEFFAKKKQWDPNERFMNQFYERYDRNNEK